MRKVDSWKACCHESGMAGLAGGVRRRTGFPVTRLAPTQQVLSAPTHRGGQTPRGIRHAAGHRAGLGGVWLDHQYRVYRGATRWSKGSSGFRVDRELKINPLTS